MAQRRLLVGDALLALLVTALSFASLFGRASSELLSNDGMVVGRFTPADGLGVVLVLIGGLSLVGRRRFPISVLVVSSAALLAYFLRGYAPAPLPYAQLVALYTVAYRCAPSVSAGGAGAVALAVLVAATANSRVISDDHFLAHLLTVVAAWILGHGVRMARAQTALLEQRTADLSMNQRARTQLAVQHERARIARELHDIVSHNVSVIAAQAGAAHRVYDVEPERAREALSSIAGVAREALTEMRRLLDVLREEEEVTALAPQPRLDALPALVEHVQRTGLSVSLTVRGAQRPLPPGVELSAYRIIQEALTNTLKHSKATEAAVTVDYRCDMIDISVHDNGRGAGLRCPAGNGLVGMRQRAALLGGELLAGTGNEGGFEVTATLPVDRPV